MDFVKFGTINWKCFEYVFKCHTVIGFFPHLFCEIQVTLWRFEIWIHTECERTIDDKLCWIKECHQKFHCMAFVDSHFVPILEVLAEWNFVWKPRVAHCLVIKIVCPFLRHWVKRSIFWFWFS